jgi:hypothetical protein
MLAIYLFGFLLFLSTEYGFQSRSGAVSLWAGRWRWRRTGARVLVLVLLGLALWRAWAAWTIAYAVVGGLWVETMAWIHRRRVRYDLRRGEKHGAPLTHLLPLIYPAVLVMLLWGIGRVAGLSLIAPRAARLSLALAIASGLMMLWAWATLIVVSIVAVVRPEQVRDTIEPRVGAGEIIGVLERYVTFVLVLVGGMAAVGFVVAAKAAARFPQFERERFAEYFLIGTLTSVGLSVLLGLGVRGLYFLLG